MFNGIRGLDVAAARLAGFDSVDEMKKKEAQREKMKALGVKGGQSRRAKEDPVALNMKAREAGCNDARSSAAWIARYIKGGKTAANAGPAPRTPEEETTRLVRRQARVETSRPKADKLAGTDGHKLMSKLFSK